jgi:hypothetical protein
MSFCDSDGRSEFQESFLQASVHIEPTVSPGSSDHLYFYCAVIFIRKYYVIKVRSNHLKTN